ncbi:hypothetical protein L6452_41038 [Arctium lappa]|uniref:Uncharacterized protein n=1 Tax=Arctium lappa TaxID=4217 RepID=A0ACB8XP53_ARCLA|nr:hypothetical protein L6452_41038 [Arctium lappa]
MIPMRSGLFVEISMKSGLGMKEKDLSSMLEDKWRSWVHGCLSTAKISVLVNGSPTKEFMMEKEGLKVAMDEAVHKGLFQGVSLPNHGPTISILQYADDTIFLGDWSRSNILNLVRILRCFHLASGLKVNFQKSKVIGVGVNPEEVRAMARRMKCNDGSLPFSYLGMPVGAKMSKIESWLPLIDKFQSKLSNWKAKSLSFGGRLILCKSVLGSLGLYLFSLYKAPKRVIKILESIRARFFWGGADRSKIAWVAWNATMNSKNHGGLGIGSLRALNLALLGKWWWRFRSDSEGIWHEVLELEVGKRRQILRVLS